MTERQHEEDQLLNELLSLDEQDDAGAEQAAPLLTRSDELRLLEEAHAAGTPTLAPVDDTLVADDDVALAPVGRPGAQSFVGELAGVARRYPLAAAGLAAAGLLLLARRRR